MWALTALSNDMQVQESLQCVGIWVTHWWLTFTEQFNKGRVTHILISPTEYKKNTCTAVTSSLFLCTALQAAMYVS